MLPLRPPGLYAVTVVLQVSVLPGERENLSAVTTVSPALREKSAIRPVCCFCYVSHFLLYCSIFKLNCLDITVTSLH